MSLAVEQGSTNSVTEASAAPLHRESRLDRLDRVMERWGERFDPIVTKETRQALKSRAFPVSFVAMLALCWFASVINLATLWDRIGTDEEGPRFFVWYLAGLLMAVCFVVPTGLYRSVVSEFEGQTFEMLVITSLSPRQIVLGKLKSASVQMLAYFAAAAPFVSFTYLLQGLSIPGILCALAIAFVAGFSACMASLMLGSLAKQSAWQVFCLLLSLGFGGIAYGVGMGAADAIISEGSGLATIGAGLGCFAYVFLFFSLLTLGVSIAQFTPTMPRPGHRIPSTPPRPPRPVKSTSDVSGTASSTSTASGA